MPVVYQANKSTTCDGSLSDNTSHKKTAVWASLKSMIDAINLDVDKLEHIYMITDSPSSQYRNTGCAFLLTKFDESNKIDVFWIFTKTDHGKGPMDGIGAAIKNPIDDAIVAAESMPDVLVRSASDVHKILNLVNVEISMYSDSDIVNVEISMYSDSDTENIKITLPHHLSLSWKEFGISKVHEIFFSAKCSNEIQWKMQTQDKDFTNATFLTKSKKRTLIKKVSDINNNESEGSPDEGSPYLVHKPID